MTFARVFNFLKRYALKHPLYVLVFLSTYPLKDFKLNIIFYKQKEIDDLLKKGKSLIRLGDGEINLMLDLKNHYHHFDPELKEMMKTIISSYSNESNYILAVPKDINKSNKELKDIKRFQVWLPFKVMFVLSFPHNKSLSYMDAHAFYYDHYFEASIAPIFKDRKVIFITKKETILKQQANSSFPWKNVVYIDVPEEDVLKAYSHIKNRLDEELFRLEDKNVVLFVGLGPVGKYLIFEYSNKGYQGVDVGKGMETMFTNESIEYMI